MNNGQTTRPYFYYRLRETTWTSSNMPERLWFFSASYCWRYRDIKMHC